MKFGVYTHAEHILEDKSIYSYGPYVKEMDLWIANFEKIMILAPLLDRSSGNIELPYNHSEISFEETPLLHFKKEGFISTIAKSILVFRMCLKVRLKLLLR